MANLEETIRDLVTRGELSDLSVRPSQNGKMFRAVFTPCSIFGNSIAEDADPVKALLLACDTAKIRKRAAFSDGDRPGRKSVGPLAQPDVEVPAELESAEPWE